MKKTINFLKYRYIAFGLSASLIIIFSVMTYLQGGFALGIDFAGGVKLTVKFENDASIEKIRSVLTKNNIDATVQLMGKEEDHQYIIGTKLVKGESSEESSKITSNVLNKEFRNIDIRSVETVGPAIGSYLRKSAIYSFMIVFVLQALYLAFRFEFKFSMGAMLSMVHDILIAFAFCGMARIELSIPVMAALLTTFGYSGNDTIVIFDRIREKMKFQTKEGFFEVINTAITETLSRTFLTSVTVLIAVLSMFLLSGETLKNFSFIMLLGVFEGVYSTIFIASPIVLLVEKITSKRVTVTKSASQN